MGATFKRLFLRLLKVSATLCLLAVLAGAAWAGWYAWQASGVVKARFEGRKWEFP